MLTFLEKIKRNALLQLFTIYLRYLIGGAFIIAAIGMGKLSGGVNLLGSIGPPIQDLAPIQQFFRVMHDSGLYWQFIGWIQIVAGVLLLTQRFAKLGALIFFGIIVNIFVITVSYEFTGTPLVTGLMVLATIYLLVWDLPTLLMLVRHEGTLRRQPLRVIDHPMWSWLGGIMLVSIVLNIILGRNMFYQLGTPLVEGLGGFIAFFAYFGRTKSLSVGRQ